MPPEVDPTLEETQDTPPTEQTPSYEDIARSKGWRPKEEFEGDEASWVDAEEFVKREPLFDKIRNQSKELKEMRKTVDAMATHFTKATQAAVNKAVNELKAKRREAIELGDADTVDAIDKEIEDQKATVVDTAGPQIPQEISEWVEANDWYNKDLEMRQFATAYNENYLRSNPGMLKESLVKTTEAVKRAFPEHFKTKQQQVTPNPVEGHSNTGATKTATKYNMGRLSSDQKRVYEQMVTRHKVLSHDEFFKSLDEIGELA